MSKELDEILSKHLQEIKAGHDGKLAQAIESLIKKSQLQLLKEVEESVMGVVMISDIFNSDLFTSYQIILFDGSTEVLRTLIRDKDIPLTEFRTQIIKSIKELGEEL